MILAAWGDLRIIRRVGNAVKLEEKGSNARTNDSFGSVNHFRWYTSKQEMMEAHRSALALRAEGCRINGENDCREICVAT